MPFAHCLDCGESALVDPSGRCPEGHVVGAAGARVAAGIGSATPHPDEPQPWVRMVEDDEAGVVAPAPRVARPLAVAVTDRDERPEDLSADSEDLFRELHALSDLADLGGSEPAAVTPTRRPTAPTAASSVAPPVPAAPPASSAPVPPPVPATPPAAVAPPAATAFVAPATPAPPSSPEEATDLDELASLVAAVSAVDDREAQTATDETRRGALAGVAELARDTPVPPPTPSASPPPAPPSRAPLSIAPPAPPAPPAAAGRDLAPVAAATLPAASTGAPVAAAALDNLTFTAKGARVGRRDRPLESKTEKRSRFRR